MGCKGQTTLPQPPPHSPPPCRCAAPLLLEADARVHVTFFLQAPKKKLVPGVDRPLTELDVLALRPKTKPHSGMQRPEPRSWLAIAWWVAGSCGSCNS